MSGVSRQPRTCSAPSARRTTPASPTRRTVLEHWDFGVGTPDRLERLDDLALGRVQPRGVEQVRHQVLALLRGRLLQGGQGELHRGAVAPRADVLHAADLLALERR